MQYHILQPCQFPHLSHRCKIVVDLTVCTFLYKIWFPIDHPLYEVLCFAEFVNVQAKLLNSKELQQVYCIVIIRTVSFSFLLLHGNTFFQKREKDASVHRPVFEKTFLILSPSSDCPISPQILKIEFVPKLNIQEPDWHMKILNNFSCFHKVG